ncbi:ABC transporter substrate-binding protein [Rhodococcus sp. NPDC079359]|uniref:ABC transporter substrate-binding protein n=1 Tax=Rhodococcus sp. NPDC079359 TaxID=3154961 RepID=UPI00344F6C9C
MFRRFTWVSVVCVAALVASSCGGGETSPGAGGGGEVDRNASLSMGWILPPPMMDPHATPSIVGAFPYLSLVYDRLVRVDNSSGTATFVPMAAESWSYSADGRTLTFALRSDATFHDGTPVNAEAVRWSLERARSLPTSTVASELTSIDGVAAPDAETVVLTLNRPAADLIYRLSTLAGAIVNPAAAEQDLSMTEAGSGPYVLDQLKVGDRASFTRYDGYFEPEAQNMASIEVVGMVDDQARLNALRSGQIDAALTKVTQSADVEQLVRDTRFGVTDTDRSAWYAMYLNTSNPALADVNVRRAMNYAIDRDGISEALLGGKCTPTSQPLQDGVVGHDEGSADRYDYDPDRARQLMAESGYGDGMQLTVLTLAGVRTSDGVAVAIKEQLAQVGIDLQLQQRDLGTAATEWRAGRADGFQYTHPGTADAGTTMAEAYLGWQYPGPLPAEVEAALLAPLDATMATDARARALAAASASASEDALELFVCAIPTQYAHTSAVVGLDEMSPPTSGGAFDLRYVGVTG